MLILFSLLGLHCCGRFIGAQDIISCGGFVKSAVPLDFSRIVVRLYTPEGSLRYETDCAPNNGYYLIPVYSKGAFQIKLHPPDGWDFSPAVHEILIDGVTDRCSKGEDINFLFKGFSVSGKVVSRGKDSGPSDLALVLKGNDGFLLEGTTKAGGTYSFAAVPPGTYTLQSDDKAMCLGTRVATISVVNDKVSLQSNLEVAGYSITGSVLSDKKPMAAVSFLLFSEHKVEIASCKTQNTKDPAGLVTDKHLVCTVTSLPDGSFTFPCVPPGSYAVVARFQSKGVSFDVSPKTVTVEVQHAPVAISQPFEIKGFSLSGRVLYASNGRGVDGAQVKVNGEVKTRTNAQGLYTLEHLETGKYHLEASLPRVEFGQVTADVSPERPALADIVAKRFELCGDVTIDVFPSGLPKLAQRKLLATNARTKETTSISTDKQGRFCIFLEPGKYTIAPQILPDEKQAGILFVPMEKDIEIVDGVPPAVTFAQLKGKVEGSAKCLGACRIKNVYLKRDDIIINTEAVASNGHFAFENVLPGHYTVTIESGQACWQSMEHAVDVRDGVDQAAPKVVFTQTGFTLAVGSSHAAQLQYRHKKENAVHGTLQLTKGQQQFCLPSPGEYDLNIASCHKFEPTQVTVTVESGQAVNFVAKQHLVSGRINMPQPLPDVILDVLSTGGTPRQLSLKTATEKSNTTKEYVYPFTLHAGANTEFVLEPVSERFLFTPKQLRVTVQDACLENVVTFVGEEGLFLTGSINPPLEGVAVIVKHINDAQIHFERLTDVNGRYSIGPLRSLEGLEFSAQKSAYVITSVKEKPGDFLAHKLAELTLKAVNLEGSPLGGVLMSLSGGVNFRSNNLTTENGTLTFVGLSPGEYFVRPLLKEFNFDPPSRVVQIAEGAAVQVELVGKRVAFSCFGALRTLNGQPVPDVTIEAISAQCNNLQEEAPTEADGTFRIRGLTPQCEYVLRVKSVHSDELNLLRTAPSHYVVRAAGEDVRDKDLVVLPQFTEMEITGRVDTEPEYLPSLKAVLFRNDDQDSAVHIASLGNAYFFFLPLIPMDGKVYTLRLESSLGSSLYEGLKTEEFTIVANRTFEHVVFHFSPRRRRFEPELSRSSYLILPITLLCVLAAYHHAKITPIVQEMLMNVVNVVQGHVTALTRTRADRRAHELLNDDTDMGDSLLSDASPKKKARMRKT